jgi:dye decolorizing peroxidase
MAESVDRRSLLRGGLLAATGAAAGAAVGVAGGAALVTADGGASGAASDGAGAEPGSGDFGAETVSASSGRQPGVDTPPGAHAIFRAYTLRSGVTASKIKGWLMLLSDDIDRLMSGRPVLADVEPELGTDPSSLTVTVGFGPGFVKAVGADAPSWLAPLPEYRIDRLEKRWGQADLLLQITCDDPLTLAHADRVLQRECAPFGKVAWVQEGFRYARGSRPDGTTMRNLFGQVDGTTNLRPGTKDFDSLVYRSGSDAFGAGSTTLVLRRIFMDLDSWDEVDRSAREDAVGRRLESGGPVTGGSEHAQPDFEAKQGLVTKVADFAHVRRARTGDDSQRIFRRAYNYAAPGAPGSSTDRAGLLFASYQADPMRQFHPIQERLAELDMMNEWTHPVGSAVFWIPPAAGEGGFIGDGLL